MGRANQKLKEQIAKQFRAIRGAETLDQFFLRLQQAGLHAPKWNRYENAAETPSLEKLFEICEKLDLSPTWVLFGKGFMRLSDVPSQETVTAGEVLDFACERLETVLQTARPDLKQKIFAAVRSIRDNAQKQIQNVSQMPQRDFEKNPTRKVPGGKK